MFSFMHHVLNSTTTFSTAQAQSPAEDSLFFGDLFMPDCGYEMDKLFSDQVPEFDLDGMKEERAFCFEESIACKSRCHSKKALSSTQDCDQNTADRSDKLSESGSQLGDGPALSTTSEVGESSLKKRQPLLPVSSALIAPLVLGTHSEDFEQQQAVRSILVEQICKLIDRQPLKSDDLLLLDPESLQLLSNFSFLIFRVPISNGSQLESNLVDLNKVIEEGAEKKKRNEERIKYVFKRVNKLLLKAFMKQEGLPIESELLAMKKIICLYFSKGQQYEKVENMPGFDRYFTLLFKPSNMYRNDLKDVFSFPSYAAVFKQILEGDFMREYKQKRITKIEAYLRNLKTEIFYSPDQSDPSILNHKLSRLPWSLAEVQKGVSLLSSVLTH